MEDLQSEAISTAIPTLVSAATAAATASIAQIVAATAQLETVTIASSQGVIAQSSGLKLVGITSMIRYFWAWQPTFMQGFILGQLSMLVLLVMAIKYILFEEPMGKNSVDADNEAGTQPHHNNAAADASGTTKGMAKEDTDQTVVQEGGFGLSKFTFFSRKQKETKPCDAAEELTKMKKEVLSRTGYDLVTHASESCDWLTVFLAQIIAKFRQDAEKHGRLVRVISEALNGELRPSVIDNIRITQFSLGSDFLRITSARMVPSTGSLGMHAELDLELHDELTLGFNTRILVNWPRNLTAALPVSMVVSLVKFVGTAVIDFDCTSQEPSISVSILPNYVLEFDIQTLIGSKAKVQNLPMLTSVISRKLEAAFAKELVMPNEKRIKIKHPFTPKTAADGPVAATSSPPAHPTKTVAPVPPTQQPYTTNAQPRSPAIEANRPTSPIVPFVAELPPDYNTQLPPPHHLRSSTNSRATVTGAKAATQGHVHSSSPLLNVPARMYTPEEQARFGLHPSRPVPNNSQQQQRTLSPEPVINTSSPQLRPIIGLSSGTSFGPVVTNPRIISASGARMAGMHGSPFLHSPSGLVASLSGSPAYASAQGNNAATGTVPAAAFASASGSSGGVTGSASNRHNDLDSDDDLKVKDSVRQRVNRVIRTVNES
ncbi:ERMES complex subunit mmm1 [Coemansia sp. RSA 986]|nr:ERMES complex subunit mmm1 [Coemansia sp. RSA 986]